MRNILNDIQNKCNEFKHEQRKQNERLIEDKRVRYEWLHHIKTSGLNMAEQMNENLKKAETEYTAARRELTEKKILSDKIKYRREGEKATAYFINLEKNMSCQRHIPRLRNDKDVYTKSQEEVNDLIVKFYENLYSNQDSKLTFDTPEEFIGKEVNHKKNNVR